MTDLLLKLGVWSLLIGLCLGFWAVVIAFVIGVL